MYAWSDCEIVRLVKMKLNWRYANNAIDNSLEPVEFRSALEGWKQIKIPIPAGVSNTDSL